MTCTNSTVRDYCVEICGVEAVTVEAVDSIEALKLAAVASILPKGSYEALVINGYVVTQFSFAIHIQLELTHYEPPSHLNEMVKPL